ncbi:MAG: S-methyl-5-thioribose-1-phosphate isomerase [Candidatus Aminicenantes bacterium]|nr:S-methyl-5-thioribose-1-phosphate isomerase [Candidatus Aminicenantes bacterium]
MWPAFEFQEDRLILLDQRLLPFEEKYVVCSDYEEVAQAIEKMIIRGAPAIGLVAAYGVVLGLKKQANDCSLNEIMEMVIVRLSRTRPTARNLFWALERMKRVYEEVKKEGKERIIERLTQEARQLEVEDVATNKKIGELGASLIPQEATILTHCNAGELATAGYGTALGVIKWAWEQGKKIKVIAGETRPWLQGAKLTCWELRRARIPVTLITDNMAGWLMRNGEINLVITGADRIARNGDTANKIGTYSLAVLAKENKIPFYVAAPFSTIDLELKSGQEIVIEERAPDEVRKIGSSWITYPDIPVRNPAFDVTPASLITSIITEKGILEPPFESSIIRLSKD